MAYGHWKTTHVETSPGLKISLIQGNIDIRLHGPAGLRKRIDEEYRSLTDEALKKDPATDLIVWPETVFSCVEREHDIYANWMTGDDDARLPADFPISALEFPRWLESWKTGTRNLMTRTAAEFGAMIVGVDRENYGARARRSITRPC